jgi:hydrogenase/urease accessory protein HupE
MALAAAPAAAHAPIPGIGNFYNGALHPFVSPAHAIALVALGLWLGQHGLAVAKQPLVALAIGLVAGLGLHRVTGEPDTDRVLLGLAAFSGLAVAAQRLAPKWLLAGIAAGIGLAVGVASGFAEAGETEPWSALAGAFTGAVLAAGYTAAMVTLAQRAWLRVAVRVIGSWCAAAAVLVLALSLAVHR